MGESEYSVSDVICPPFGGRSIVERVIGGREPINQSNTRKKKGGHHLALNELPSLPSSFSFMCGNEAKYVHFSFFFFEFRTLLRCGCCDYLEEIVQNENLFYKETTTMMRSVLKRHGSCY